MNEKYLLQESDILIKNCKHTRKALRLFLHRHKILDESKCAICGVSDWNGKPLVLRIDHINGINNDNRIENLRWICANCDSQLDTFAGRNKHKCSHVV